MTLNYLYSEKEQHVRQLDTFYTNYARTENGITNNQCIVFANVRSEESRDRRSYAKLCKSLNVNLNRMSSNYF